MKLPLMSTSPVVRSFAAVAFVAFVAAQAHAGLEYTAGHADIGIGFEDDELFLHYHIEGGIVGGVAQPDEEFEPADLVTRVADSLNFTSLNPAIATFTGADQPGGNGDLWILPQGEVSGVPFLGIAAEELDAIDGWQSASLTLESMTFTPFGTGDAAVAEFSLYQINGGGGLDGAMSTFDAGPDTLPLSIGAHDHYNWGFTEQGIYELSFLASAENDGSGSLASGIYTDTESFVFLVGSATPAAIPEPGTMSLAGLAACGLLGGGAAKRRRNRKAAES
ncbi:MAG: choice-of-anchor M domain-containing protein [Planctomycetota bacterium]